MAKAPLKKNELKYKYLIIVVSVLIPWKGFLLFGTITNRINVCKAVELDLYLLDFLLELEIWVLLFNAEILQEAN